MAAGEAVQAILEAAHDGEVERVTELLDQDLGLLDARDYNMTPLIEAAHAGHLDVVRLLLDRGADVNAVNEAGWAALHYAAKEGYRDLVVLMLERGADATIQCTKGVTAFMLACFRGRHEAVDVLLHQPGGASQSLFGWTAVSLACCAGHVEILRTLLLHGADHTVPVNSGLSPREIAEDKGHQPCVDLIVWWERELERAYVLQKAVRVMGLGPTRQGSGRAWPVPPFLLRRVERKRPMPVAYVQGGAGKGGRVTRAEAKRRREAGGEEGEEEREATIHYVLHAMPSDLFEELMTGFHR